MLLLLSRMLLLLRMLFKLERCDACGGALRAGVGFNFVVLCVLR
jgi:hypothetical protein